MDENLLEIRNLSAAFLFDRKPVEVIRDISFSVRKEEILGVVGESGSGKSVTAKSVLRLIPDPPGRVLGGEIVFEGRDVLKMSKREILNLRGKAISMIFQEPMTSLNPVYTCGDQIVEAIVLHRKISRKAARAKAVELLSLVGVSMPEQRMDAYPHQLSGGMKQRVMIAMAISCNARLLIADEPTTALDPTIQAQVIELIKRLQRETGMSVLYITHDLGVVAEVCDRVVVMYAGMVMEIASTRDLFRSTAHPYTYGLMRAMPRLESKVDTLYSIDGVVPHITEMPAGCRFAPRCSCARSICRQTCPDILEVAPGHLARCHFPRVSADARME